MTSIWLVESTPLGSHALSEGRQACEYCADYKTALALWHTYMRCLVFEEEQPWVLRNLGAYRRMIAKEVTAEEAQAAILGDVAAYTYTIREVELKGTPDA